MKLSFSLALLAAAALSVQAAVTPNAAGKCISGSSGKNNGDGYNGFCCKSSDDCFESCLKGVCNGPSKPTKTTTVPTSTETPGTCIKGSAGLGEGDGYKGYCCESSDDCFDACIKGVCNGPAPPTKTTTVPTSTVTPGTCIKGSAGLGQGDGYKGYCCESSDDCFNSCKSGVCDGPVAPTKTTTVPTSTVTPGTCIKGSAGLGQGDGYKGYCCESSDDCFNSCKSGVCDGPVAPSQTSDKPVPTGGAECKAGFKGKENGKGPKNACCSTQADCQEDCVKGKCT
ncbi:unnamed protein product [Mucor fragilis]